MGEKVVLITGCNSPEGIGFSLVKELALKKYTVIATVKDKAKALSLENAFCGHENVIIQYLDLTSEDMIVSLIGELTSKNKAPDVLINNAGYGLLGALEQTDIDQARQEYEVNLFGTVRLIQEVLPAMRAKKAGHIINVSSVFCSALSLPYAGFYVGSKAALEKVCESLAIEVAPWNIRVTNFQPGPVKTKLSREFGRRDIGAEAYPDYFATVQKWVSDVMQYESPQESARAISAIIENVGPHLVEHSVPRVEQYASKYVGKKDMELQDILKFYYSSKD